MIVRKETNRLRVLGSLHALHAPRGLVERLDGLGLKATANCDFLRTDHNLHFVRRNVHLAAHEDEVADLRLLLHSHLH